MEEQKRDLVFLSCAHNDLEKVRKVYEGYRDMKNSEEELMSNTRELIDTVQEFILEDKQNEDSL